MGVLNPITGKGVGVKIPTSPTVAMPLHTAIVELTMHSGVLSDNGDGVAKPVGAVSSRRHLLDIRLMCFPLLVHLRLHWSQSHERVQQKASSHIILSCHHLFFKAETYTIYCFFHFRTTICFFTKLVNPTPTWMVTPSLWKRSWALRVPLMLHSSAKIITLLTLSKVNTQIADKIMG